jgi:hypothetical protein
MGEGADETTEFNATLPSKVLGAKQKISGNTYIISTKLCWPAHLKAPPTKSIQLLTHGAGFDKPCWDFYSADYSYRMQLQQQVTPHSPTTVSASAPQITQTQSKWYKPTSRSRLRKSRLQKPLCCWGCL